MTDLPADTVLPLAPTYSWPAVLLVLAACVVGSAFFSGSETGLMSASRIRLRRFERERHVRHGRLVEHLLRRLDDSILTCLIGNNLVNVLASAVATVALAERLGPGGKWLAAVSVTAVLIVAGEILPKVFSREYPERLVLAAAPTLRAVMGVLAPVRWVLGAYARLWGRLLPGEGDSGRSSLSRDAMAALLLAHLQPGGQDRRFAEELDRFLALSQVKLRQIMLPLAAAVTVRAEATLGECAATAARSGHSRLPVVAVDGQLIGWILVRDLLFTEEPPEAGVPPALLRTNLLVDAGLTPYELFEEMQWQRQQLAIVVEGDGRPIGLVTLENLVEAVVGRIEDEFDAPPRHSRP